MLFQDYHFQELRTIYNTVGIKEFSHPYLCVLVK